MRAAADDYLVIHDLKKVYDGHQRQVTVAVESVSLTVKQGEFVALLGPSGCGKSTLLQAVAGLICRDGGAVLLEGEEVTAPPAGAVYVFQQYSRSLLPWRTAGQNVALVLESQGLGRREISERCRDYLRMVGLEPFRDHYPWQLSGGMQQRVAIARALATRPRMLLLDEPFSAVDALTRLGLQSLILDLWQSQGLTILLVTHDVDEAVYLADRVVVLTTRPATVDTVVDTGLPRPRDAVTTRKLPRFLQLREQLTTSLLSAQDASS